MKYGLIHIVQIALTILIVGCKGNPDVQSPVKQFLHENWEFREEGSFKWHPAKVPGTVHLDLMTNAFIDDPYYRTNDKEQQWISESNWEYRFPLEIDETVLSHKKVELVFEGLDTYAKVYLNDSLIGESNNMFLEYRFPCKHVIHEGANELRIQLLSPIEETRHIKDSLPYPLVARMEPVREEEKLSMLCRKAPFHFGWDWGPRLITSGIWRPAYLYAWSQAKIEDLYIKQDSISEEKAWLNALVEIVSDKKTKNAEVELMLEKDGSIISKKTNLKKGKNQVVIPICISSPELWWPNGMGEQILYTFKTKLLIDDLVIDSISKRTGLRNIKLIQEKDAEGSNFCFEVNGIPVFMKGANYIPMDNFTPRVSVERYQALLTSVVEANMNMLRVWGGGIYENDIFYELCDEKGILLWHDFMFACAFYPNSKSFFENVKTEVAYNIKRLRNHPCIAMWCGNNEVKLYLNEREDEKEKYAEAWKAYDTLFYKIIPGQISALSPDIAYWPSSPSTSYYDKNKEKWASGNMHYWGVWHEKELFSNFLKKENTGRFMSEFGFQSYPNMETVNYYTLPEDHYIESEVMLSHQRNTWGNGIMKQYMKEEYKSPKDFPSFLYSSQLLQASALKVAVEHHRRSKPYTMGSLYWQLNDCWPVASWSSIDYFGRWKASQYFAKNFFSPVLVSPFQEDNNIKIQIISDKEKTYEGVLQVRLIETSGEILFSKDILVVVTPFSNKTYFTISKKDLLNGSNLKRVFLSADLVVAGESISCNEYYFSKMKDFSLIRPDIEITVKEDEKGMRLELSSNVLVKNVCLDAYDFTGRFSDNYFDLIPGKEKEIIFASNEIINPKQFQHKLKIMSLIDTYK